MILNEQEFGCIHSFSSHDTRFVNIIDLNYIISVYYSYCWNISKKIKHRAIGDFIKTIYELIIIRK